MYTQLYHQRGTALINVAVSSHTHRRYHETRLIYCGVAAGFVVCSQPCEGLRPFLFWIYCSRCVCMCTCVGYFVSVYMCLLAVCMSVCITVCFFCNYFPPHYSNVLEKFSLYIIYCMLYTVLVVCVCVCVCV